MTDSDLEQSDYYERAYFATVTALQERSDQYESLLKRFQDSLDAREKTLDLVDSLFEERSKLRVELSQLKQAISECCCKDAE